jgi:hypothetical protein
MQIALILLLVLLVRVAQYVGQLYGWYYHALILIVLGVSLAALLRLVAPKMPGPAPKLQPTDDPEGRRLREFIESAHKDFEQSIPALRRDAMLIPVFACAPAVVILCVFQQRSYLPDYSPWFRLSFIPVLLYVIFRYIIPKGGGRKSQSKHM